LPDNLLSGNLLNMNEIIRQRINLLCPLLKDSDPEVRATASRAIEHLEVTSDIDEVLQALKTGSMGARIAAIHALGEIGGEKVIAPLVYCAGRPEADIRSAAVEVLGRLAVPATLPVLMERLDDANQAVQARVIIALGRFPSSAGLCERLRPFLNERDGSLEAEAALTLARLGDVASVADIAALLSSPHVSVRMSAATAISLLPI
jgi:HEAT repeat protein